MFQGAVSMIFLKMIKCETGNHCLDGSMDTGVQTEDLGTRCVD